MNRNSDMKLSIIVPVYNVKNYIRECLDSIVSALSVCDGDTEVIVIDDGSTDGCDKIVDEYKIYERITVVHQINAGVAAARNRGLRLSIGEWVYFVDSDDWMDRSAIKDILREIDRCPEADMFLLDGYINEAGVDKEWDHFTAETVWGDERELSALWRGILFYPACSDVLGVTNRPLAAPWDKVYRKQFLIDNNLSFCEELRVLDDMVFNMEVCGLVRKVVYSKIRTYHYRIVETSITHSYKSNRLEMDMAVWKYIYRYLDQMDALSDKDTSAIRGALQLRIVKSFGICCMQQFFNRENKQSLVDKLSLVKNTMNLPVYHNAFQSADASLADIRLKMILYCARIHSAWGMWVLSLFQRLLNRVASVKL